MKRSPKLSLYAMFAAVFFLAALVLGRPEIAALAAPFAVLLVVGLSSPGPAPVQLSFTTDRERASEGEVLEGTLTIAAPDRTTELRLALLNPRGVKLSAPDTSLLLHLRPGQVRTLPVRLGCERWGAYRLGDAVWRAGDTAGLRVFDGRTPGGSVLRVYPKSERLRSLIAPMETQLFSGNRVARGKGEGIEFADIRPFVPGDRPRRVNWRASALRGTLFVNEQHPERNSDVVLLLDSFASAERNGEGTLDLAVRAAASLAVHYLQTRDRVGLVSFGGTVRWLTPSSGARQVYRIMEALLETEIIFSFVWRDIDVLPPRSLPPQALVVAITPLLDDRALHSLIALRRRGFDLVVIETSPLGFAETGQRLLDDLAVRFWSLWREAMRLRLEELGVAVVEWDGQTSLAACVEEVRAFRRFTRYASR